LPDSSIDLILTDPPYDNKSLYLYETLAVEAYRILKDGGFAIVYTGNDKLPEIMSYFSEAGLTYFRMFAGIQLNSNSRLFHKRLFSNWRPIVVYSKGKSRPFHWSPDAIKTKRDKRYHAWGQDYEPLVRWIEAFTMEDAIVLDPFMGGGATMEACIESGRNWIGFELDPGNVQTIRERLVNIGEM